MRTRTLVPAVGEGEEEEEDQGVRRLGKRMRTRSLWSPLCRPLAPAVAEEQVEQEQEQE